MGIPVGLSAYLTKTRAHLMWRFKRICEERCYDEKQVWSFRTSKLSKEELAKLVCELENEDRGVSVPPTVEKLKEMSEETLDYVTSELEVERAELAAARRHREALNNSRVGLVDEREAYKMYRRQVSETLAKFALAICASPVNQARLDEAVAAYANLEGYSDLGDAEAALTVKFMEWQKAE